MDDKDTKLNSDLINFFEDFIKKGEVSGEKEIVDGLTVKLKVLNTEELLTAESFFLNVRSGLPNDTLLKVRSANILSLALMSINGSVIDKSHDTDEERGIRKKLLYQQILKMPAIVVQKMYEFYIELVKKQNKFYEDIPATEEKMENFSQHRSEQ